MTSKMPQELDLEPLDFSLGATMCPWAAFQKETIQKEKPFQTQGYINEALRTLDMGRLTADANVSSFLTSMSESRLLSSKACSLAESRVCVYLIMLVVYFLYKPTSTSPFSCNNPALTKRDLVSKLNRILKNTQNPFLVMRILFSLTRQTLKYSRIKTQKQQIYSTTLKKPLMSVIK